MQKKGLAVYPDKRVEEVKVDGLADMQAVVGGLIEPVTLADGSTMYVNEEGRIFGLPFNSIASDVAGLGGAVHVMLQGVVGPVLLLGPLDNLGDHTDLTDQVRVWVRRVAIEA